MSRSPPKTLVFYDTEATGFPVEGDLPKFTELCFLAVSQEDFLQSTTCPPRVVNKLILCFNPKKQMTASAVNASGLTNTMLQDSTTFSEQASMVTHFLNHLPQPVCLVAHSGDKFDFPLLARHLEDADVDFKDVDQVTCADSFRAFKSVCPMRSYKLGEIYARECGRRKSGTHSAEVDSEMLMEIVHSKDRQRLVRWFHVNSKPLSFFKCPPEEFCSRFRGYV